MTNMLISIASRQLAVLHRYLSGSPLDASFISKIRHLIVMFSTRWLIINSFSILLLLLTKYLNN